MLNQHGKELTVPQHAIQPRKTKAVALDNKGNSITSRDIIKVVAGPHQVREGLECIHNVYICMYMYST